ncbi:hypothetical protein ACQCT5_02915 [Sutcliffiella halmapala]
MKANKPNIIYIVLGVGLLIFLTLWVLSEKKNDAYEKFLSDGLVDQMVRISSLPNYNLGILQDIFESGKISNSQADELEQGFNNLAFDIQDVSYMGNSIGRLQFSSDVVVSVNNDYSEFFLKLDFENEEIQLTEEQIFILEKMIKLMKKYKAAVNETLKSTPKEADKGLPLDFFDIYEEKGIADDYWIDLLQKYESETDVSFRLN